jgi:hypothetical protein
LGEEILGRAKQFRIAPVIARPGIRHADALDDTAADPVGRLGVGPEFQGKLGILGMDHVMLLLPPVPVHANKMGELLWHEL